MSVPGQGHGCYECFRPPRAEESFFHTPRKTSQPLPLFTPASVNRGPGRSWVFHLFYKNQGNQGNSPIQSKVLVGIHNQCPCRSCPKRDVIPQQPAATCEKSSLKDVSHLLCPKQTQLRRNIAASDAMTELLTNVISRLTHDHVHTHIQICICTCHFQVSILVYRPKAVQT